MDVPAAHRHIMERAAPRPNRMCKHADTGEPDIESDRGEQQSFPWDLAAEVLVINGSRVLVAQPQEHNGKKGTEDCEY